MASESGDFTLVTSGFRFQGQAASGAAINATHAAGTKKREKTKRRQKEPGTAPASSLRDFEAISRV
jgi:hypothetical protein